MIPRFFCPQPLAANSLADLPPAVAHHALRVLRLGVGDAVVLFNGEGGAYPGRIAVAGRGVRVQLAEWDSGERESPLDLTLAQALPSADKMDFVVQKAVELGVARIQPLLAARSVVRLAGERAERRVAHWQQVAVSSCEQCGRNRVPPIAPVLDLRQWLGRLPPDNETQRLLLSPQGGRRPRELAGTNGFLLLIGPEGGLEAEEAAAARLAGFADLSLGPRVLRTETAGPAALAALGALCGDL
ncbi:MAG: 16S rRNA (uracil(1498)-N(3))-methyltransferase [Rhodocyclaceae bacterium]|nr:MAG: 16S rRNA (uracil(1498)-N(3))-methyltransferase [Rhodocyclaceae bacterium]MBE7420986.1 16S rRNA (uracil(1498)-N(3))-methyltransferase [Zoogloeaceae bacterium]MCC6878983.1 16S rRNA (uracil(1498)-N(3))-methyltransferase [Rhodocyclaceae bacterium]MCG3167754.1 Ribosomal RNA small subunit methyltransferase E [Bacteroidia bacterium]MCK6384124.1 16S rRNA (uracil(1498)-N(3))-methyltransferase [Rhodocyclaceae bacterium]